MCDRVDARGTMKEVVMPCHVVSHQRRDGLREEVEELFIETDPQLDQRDAIVLTPPWIFQKRRRLIQPQNGEAKQHRREHRT